MPRPRASWPLVLACLLWAAPALADVVSPAPETVAVTIYRDRPGVTRQITDRGADAGGLALISETRTIDVPAGQSRISFRGVADGVVPETAKIEGLPAHLVEYNFDYDLLSPGSLIARSIDRPVRLVRTDVKTGKASETAAIIRSGPEGVMLEINGKLEALGCMGAPERLVFDRIPPGLADRPTLSMIVSAAAPGRYKVTLTYLATGFDWSADYVARIAPDDRTFDLSGWITLVNHGDTTFTDAPTGVVAGRWNREADDGTDREPPQPLSVEASCWPMSIDWVTRRKMFAKFQNLNEFPQAMAPPPPMMAPARVMVTGARIAKMSELGDYKLYTLPDPTTVAARQTKQVQLLDQPGVPFQRIYSYRFSVDAPPGPGEGSAPATVLLRLENKAASGLGKPLPAGTIAVMAPDGRGHEVLAGEKRLDDIPVGLPLDIELGRAMDVRVRTRVVSRGWRGQGASRRERVVVEAVLANDKAGPVSFEFRNSDPGRGFRIVSETAPHGVKGGAPVWTFKLDPAERKVLSYAFDQAD